VQLINPGVIILGGQVAQAGDLFIKPLQARVHELCLAATNSSLRIVQSSFGSEANIVGAVTLALQDIE
jgi:glucokinase